MAELPTTNAWEQRYQRGDTPWSHDVPVGGLLERVQDHLPSGASLLEVGCGMGVEAVALASLGYQVTGCDLAATALSATQARAHATGVDVNVHCQDVLADDAWSKRFEAVVDVAVLHTYRDPAERHRWVTGVTRALEPGGWWFHVSCVWPDVLAVGDATGVRPPPSLHDEDLWACWDGRFVLRSSCTTVYPVTREGVTAPFPARLVACQLVEEAK